LIFDRKFYKTSGNAELIYGILKKEQLSVNQLAERINMTRQGVRFHIHNLINQRKIKLVDDKKSNWEYSAC
jgi:predicted ArsR family transcriptional regulator